MISSRLARAGSALSGRRGPRRPAPPARGLRGRRRGVRARVAARGGTPTGSVLIAARSLQGVEGRLSRRRPRAPPPGVRRGRGPSDGPLAAFTAVDHDRRPARRRSPRRVGLVALDLPPEPARRRGVVWFAVRACRHEEAAAPPRPRTSRGRPRRRRIRDADLRARRGRPRGSPLSSQLVIAAASLVTFVMIAPRRTNAAPVALPDPELRLREPGDAAARTARSAPGSLYPLLYLQLGARVHAVPEASWLTAPISVIMLLLAGPLRRARGPPRAAPLPHRRRRRSNGRPQLFSPPAFCRGEEKDLAPGSRPAIVVFGVRSRDVRRADHLDGAQVGAGVTSRGSRPASTRPSRASAACSRSRSRGSSSPWCSSRTAARSARRAAGEGPGRDAAGRRSLDRRVAGRDGGGRRARVRRAPPSAAIFISNREARGEEAGRGIRLRPRRLQPKPEPRRRARAPARPPPRASRPPRRRSRAGSCPGRWRTRRRGSGPGGRGSRRRPPAAGASSTHASSKRRST